MAKAKEPVPTAIGLPATLVAVWIADTLGNLDVLR
jgi:hypothetical protein